MVERHLRRVAATGARRRGAAARRGRARSSPTPGYWLESFRLPGSPPAEVAAGFAPTATTHTSLDGLAAGNGVILALPHLGGWEWAGRWIADQGHPITVVVEPLEPPELFEWFAALRSSLGMTVVPLGPGAGRDGPPGPA